MTVADVYQRVCSRWLEPYNPGPGLQSGIFTLQDFYNHFATTAADFLERTGIQKFLATQAVHFSIPQYEVPDQLSNVENLFVSGRILDRTNLQDLNSGIYQWRRATGIPRSFHQDGLPPKTVELYPNPYYEGTPIPFPAPAPPPPIAVFTSPETNNVFAAGDFYPQWRDLTMIGPQVPLNADLTVKTSWALGDTITGMPDSAVPYLAFGVLAKMFSDDSEAKDVQRAEYCTSRYEEGVALFQQIMSEKLYDDADAAM